MPRRASADSERAQGQAMAAKLSMASLTRAWTLLMKGLQETLAAPSPLRAAEMALIRLCYAADLPSPSDAIKALQNGAAPAAARPSPQRPHGAAAVAAARPLALRPNRVVATASQPAAAQPNPKSFTEIVALFEARREARLVHHLMHHVHEVRCEPGRIEFRPAAKAPPDLAPRLSELLSQWTGRRWIATVSSAAGKPTPQRAEGGQGRRAAQPGREQSAGAGDPEDLPRRQAGRRATQGRADLAGAGLVERRRGAAGRRGVSRRRRHPESEY